MAIGQGWQLIKRLLPFVVLLLVYESFRGMVPHLNNNVNYQWLIDADRFLGFGTLPTTTLQSWLWNGSVQWFDFLLYLFYMAHFVFPFTLALIIWKKRESHYWRYIAAFLLLSFAGFLTYLIFPAAPPWLAAQKGLIEPISRISSDVWFALGVNDFPSLYNKISPNPVAAMPSLHAAYATLVAIFTIKLFKSKYRWLVLVYPFAIYFGTVYQGEHYLIDELAGGLYAVAAYLAAPYVLTFIKRAGSKLKVKLNGSKKLKIS
jgi:membrane-associated phospholipid phosphatase